MWLCHDSGAIDPDGFRGVLLPARVRWPQRIAAPHESGATPTFVYTDDAADRVLVKWSLSTVTAQLVVLRLGQMDDTPGWGASPDGLPHRRCQRDR